MADRFVLDTSVLIDFRRDHPHARALVVGLLTKGAAFVHPVVAAELLQGVFDRDDQRRTIELLATFKRPAVKPSDFEACLSLMSQFRLSHGIGWPDCLIAATCIRLGLPLVTTNDKHFRPIRGLGVMRPY